MQVNAALVITLLLLLRTSPQNDAPKVRVSKDPLTKEQIAVYRAVLNDYLREDKSPLNLNSETEMFDGSRDSFDEGCVKGFDLETTPAPVIHKLDRRVATGLRIVLVDADRQQKKIAENDPQNTVKKAIDGHEKVSEKQMKDSVTQAFSTGLFTFSEIAFEKQHRRAVVSYSFVCGGLCGQGRTVVLKNFGQTWKIINGCGGWIS